MHLSFCDVCGFMRVGLGRRGGTSLPSEGCRRWLSPLSLVCLPSSAAIAVVASVWHAAVGFSRCYVLCLREVVSQIQTDYGNTDTRFNIGHTRTSYIHTQRDSPRSCHLTPPLGTAPRYRHVPGVVVPGVVCCAAFFFPVVQLCIFCCRGSEKMC